MLDNRSPGSKAKRFAYDLLEASGGGLSGIVDRVLVLLVIGNLLSIILETVPPLKEAYADLFLGVEWVTVTVFALEYGARLWVADLHPPFRRHGPVKARLLHLAQPSCIIDFLAFGPTLVGLIAGVEDVNVLVVFRLLRFLKLARYSPGMRSLLNAFVSERRAILASAVLMAGLILTTATIMYLLERRVQPEAFGSIPAAMYWAVTTLTTVGYGDVVPVSAAGKLLAGLTMLAGLCMFALPVGIIATAFAREIRSRDFVVTWGMVARVPIFSDLDASEIAEVTRLLRAQTVEAGMVVTQKGEPAYAMYFIASGRVDVDGPMGHLQLGEGSFFGEMAVLHKGRRTADVVALSSCRLLVLDADDLHVLMKRRPKIGTHIRAVAEARIKAGGATVTGDFIDEELAQSRPVEAGPV
ncbi:cyclic nucleotide-gated ion channel [Oryzibacter oryziterrae]|uniref:cyclic nucleotide-gated ion channel n=1 Tax=Oryzibacter oryziterrae TaxID=2766474 RepID=UPI001F1D7C45|nr:cyclic nucleotide-gated ion channel [Oryzibacter oryziterrae]